MKRKLSFLLTIIMLLSVMTVGLFNVTANAAATTSYGTCGDRVRWTLDDTGLLTISGEGEMYNYDTSIGTRSPWYSYRSSIKKVIIQDGVTSIGNFAFCGYYNMTSIDIPNSVTRIGESALSQSSLEELALPENLTHVEPHTFSSLAALTTITIPSSVTSIGEYAFYHCTGLETISIPNSVKNIDANAFFNCKKLSSVYYCGTEQEWEEIAIYDDYNYTIDREYNKYLTSANRIYCPNGHFWADVPCSTPKTCLGCGYGDSNIKGTHSWIDATCGAPKTCIECGDTEGNASDNHYWINATCTAPKTCSECGTTEGSALGHSWVGDSYCISCGSTIGGDTSIEYTITYHLDGGTNALKNPDVYTAEDNISLKNATKAGYAFAGWFLDPQKTMQISEISNRTGNLNLYAKFTPKDYTATFDDNGATASSPLTITFDDTLGTTKTVSLNNGEKVAPYSYWVPQRDGYAFAGWYCGAELVSNSHDITTDITLTAKWVKCVNEYDKSPRPLILGDTIKCNSAYGRPITPTLIEIHSLTGTFYGTTNNYGDSNVYLYNDYSTWGDVDYSNNSNLDKHYLYVYISGQYKTINYEIVSGKYDDIRSRYCEVYDVTNDKILATTGSGSFEVLPGTLLRIMVGASYRSGYTTYYGQIKLTLGDTYDCEITPKNERTLEQEFDSYINAPSVSKTGYDFIGWYDSNGTQLTDTWKYTQNQTFVAKWFPTKYNIVYHLDGAANSLSNPAFYTIENTLTLAEPTKPGYTFKGWYSDPDFTTRVTKINKQTGDISLYAKFEVNTYNFTLNANGGVFAPKVTFMSDGVEIKSCCLYEQNNIVAYRPEYKNGYIFAGWYLDNSYTNLFKFNGAITNDITLYAKWIECSDHIINIEATDNFKVDIKGKNEQLYAFVPLVDGTIVITSSSDSLDLYGILYDVTKNKLITADDISDNDLDFSYTYNVKAGELYYIAVKGTTSSTTGEATIDINWTGSCTITGTTYQNKQKTIVYDTALVLPTKPIREGYMFLGWFDENGVQVTNGIWNFATDKTLTARWEAATYHTVTFKNADGTILSTETYYLSEALVAPELPTKASDHIGSYYAKWDNNYTGECTGDAVYTVVFEIKEYTNYTVIFKDWNGNVISEQIYHYDDTVVAPASPTRDADNTYTYAFDGWDKEIVACAGNAIYTATYTNTYINYTVVFEDENGKLLSTGVYHYGDLVVAPTAPTKAADNIYTYTFADWDKEVVPCAGNTTYVATYKAIFIDYTITFEDEDGTVLGTDTYHYGEAVTVPSDPTKEANKTYTYTFAGWDSEVVACDGSKTYTATYTPVYIDYTVVFKDYDGEIISSATYHYGETIDIPASPTRETDVIGSYTFAGWNQTVVACAGNVTYTATYNITYTNYTVTFVDWNGDVISTQSYHYDDPVIIPADPARTADNMYTYAFAGWDNTVTDCKGNMTYTATYSETYIDYTVTFKDEDGTELGSAIYHYGDKVVAPMTPIKAADQMYTYTFNGWDNEVAACEGNAIYTATYAATYINYTVVFEDENGKVLSTNTYHYGDAVTVPQAPTKAADLMYTYTFNGWNRTVVTCEGDATYTATYRATYIDYTVTFADEDGSVISEKTYHYGEAVTAPNAPYKEADKIYTYTFAGWDSLVVVCDGNKTYTATYTSTFIEYTVTFVDHDGSEISSAKYHYGQAVTRPSDPTRAADNTYTYAFASWDKVVTACTESTVYTATYTSTYIEYEIVFNDENGELISSETYHYGEAVVVPKDPVKSADKVCRYDFAGWDSEVTVCLGNKTYTATFSATNIDYTVVFKDWNGELISSEIYHFGDKVVAPDAPLRNADNTYTYTFKDWGKEVTNCAGDEEYTAVYSKAYIEYNITFLDWDGSTITTVKYHYGQPIVAIADPERESDETYTYTFSSWNKALETCTGNASFTAQYESTFINYTVVFKDYDGSVISREIYHFGESVVIPENPTRVADNTYTYTFSGWGNVSLSCNGSKEYTATYDATYIDYTVVFLDYNGDLISSRTYHYNDTVEIPADPTRVADKTYTYTFKGWDKEVVACVGHTTYTATYTPTYINYTVVFKDYNDVTISTNTYHYGDAVTAPTAPIRASDVIGSYTFSGWDRTVVACAGDATYAATYELTYTDYTVIFKNEDGTVLSTNTYHYGDTIIVPTAPTKAADNTYTYTFKGWDKAIVTCAGNASYIATYNVAYINYTVVFKNAAGVVLSAQSYHYGDQVTVPETPIKKADKTYTYTFAGWDKEVVPCAGDATYTATYTEIYIEYTVVFKNEDGSVISEKTYHYGDEIVAPEDPSKESDSHKYVFTGWDSGVTNCEGDISYTATFEQGGLATGPVAGIAAGSTVVAGAGGFSLFWFVIKKKRFSDLFRKK